MPRTFKQLFQGYRIESMQKKGDPGLGHGHHACCFHCVPNILVWPPLWHLADPLSYLPPFPGCVWAGGAESIHPPRLPLSKGRTLGCPSFHGAPQVSGIWSSSLKACKGHFLEEPALTNLAFFSCQGKSMGGRGPWPSPHSDPEPSRAHAGGSKQEPQALLPQDTWSCQALCWSTQGPAG